MITAQALRAAGHAFDQRHDSFAAGKAESCYDLAARLERAGTFVSERQAAFAAKLVEWAQPRKPASGATPVARVDALHAVMQRHAQFFLGDVTLSRRNGDQLVWIKHSAAERVVGKIDNGEVTLWSRPGVDNAAVRGLLEEVDGAPLATAIKFGRASGRCCSCGRDLTDPDSIAAGIGPICATKFE